VATEALAERFTGGLSVRGAPPPGSPGGPLVALAAAPPVGAGRVDPGRGQPSLTRQPRLADADAAVRAVVRILAAPPGGGIPVPAGVGFLVDRRGYILTHDHLIRDAKGLEVALADGRKAPVKQVWRDQLAGVAVLKIEGIGLTTLPLGDSGGLRVGDATIVVGWPTVTPSPTSRAIIRATGSATGGNLVLDAPISAEHAGSPLVDLRGQVVGIATSRGSLVDASPSGGFAIPIDRAKATLRQAQSTATAQSPPTTTPDR
jgi:putative serine protease PepD